jgi:outer membrane autotransporter protein
MFAIGGASGTVTHFDGASGKDRLDAYSLGGYWTHFGATGWYLDTVLQSTLYDANSSANRGFAAFATKGVGIAASAETGKPFHLDSGYFIEPQAQVIYQSIDFNDGYQATTGGSALVMFSNEESFAGRFGARIGRTWRMDHGRQITAWIRPNIWHEFLGDPVTRFSSQYGPVAFRSSLGGTWSELNVGLSGQLNLNTTAFANASYNQRFDGRGYSYDGKAGIRFNW